jgi:group I intron endonuclease
MPNMKKEKSTQQYYLYHIINQINNKIYVGITTNCEKRWKRHINQSNHKIKHAIHWAIAKYGVNNFKFTEIETCINWEHACERERFWIKSLKQTNHQLYNETDGGEGSFGVRRYGKENPNFGKNMKPHVKEQLIKIRRKLTNEQIQQIISLYQTNTYTQTQLSKDFNISLTQIHRIIKGKSWGDKKHDQIITKKNLTKEQVKELRSLYSSNKFTQKELSIKYNISLSHTNRIINRKKWSK